MEKLLFFDIDGTLAMPGRNPSCVTKEAIRLARKNGHKVFLSTGRLLENVPPAVLDIGFDGGIFSAGGYVVAGDTILSQHFLCQALLHQILVLLHNADFFYMLETADGKFKSENTSKSLAKLDFSQSSSEMQRIIQDVFCDKNLMDISSYKGQPVYKVAFYSADASALDGLICALEGAAKIVRFDNLVPDFPLIAGEITDIAINKGAALLEICKYYHKTAEECIAFGDSMNDAEILQTAGLGIAMGNAEDKVLALADMVCDRCENDGVAKALHSLSLI